MRLEAAHRLDLTGFHDTQQLRVDGQRELANLVEKNDAAVCQVEQSTLFPSRR
jgi:hypothetical protein